MADGTCDILLRAIARNAGVVLSLPWEGALRHCRSRFLSDVPAGFWVESPAGEQPLIHALLAAPQEVGVSFKDAHHKVLFATRLQRQAAHRIDFTTRVPALLLSFPPDAQSLKRCTRQAVRVPAGADLGVRVWRIAERAPLSARALGQQEVDCDVRDISVGGLGLVFRGRGGRPPQVAAHQRLRVELYHPGGVLVLEGRVRHLAETAGSGPIRGGIEFAPVPDGEDSGHAFTQLTRIVRSLLREQVRGARAVV